MYITGLVLVTSAVELSIALVLTRRGALPAPSSSFLLVYLLVDIGLFVVGGFLASRGLRAIRSERPPVPAEAPSEQPPP